jgi:hypothetical protein
MYKLNLCVILLLATPALATIMQQRNAFKWTCSGTISGTSGTGTLTCYQTFSITNATDLIAVWTTWQSSVTLTATVYDSYQTPPNVDTYVSAVGPTVQPTQASGTPTSAQVFYAKNIQTGGGADTVTVTLTGPAGTPVPSFGMVMVEYSGLDQNYPLDSVSEAISNSGSPSNALDSGTSSPANASLLVFGGGFIDYGSGNIVPGSGFSVVQSGAIGSASAITEQNTTAITTNNALQRATACLGPSSINPCSSYTGNWLMQMAIFRAASWTNAQGTSSTRSHQVLDASQFPGADCGMKVNAAEAALGSSAGEIQVSNACGTTVWSPVTISNSYHTLRFTGQGPFTVKTILLSGSFDNIIGPAYITEVGSATQTIGNVITLSGNDGRVENLTIDGSAPQDNNTTGTQVDDIIVTGSRNWVVNNRIVATQGIGITVMGTAASGYGGGPGGDRNHVVGNKVFNCNASPVNPCIAVGNQVDYAGPFANYNEIIGNFVDAGGNTGAGSGDCIFVTAGLDSNPLSNGTMAKFNSVVGNTVRNCGDTSIEIGEGTFHAIAENNVADVFNNGIMARDAIDPLIKGNSVYLERTALGPGISLIATPSPLTGPDGRVVMEGNTVKGYIPINQYGNGSCFDSSYGGVHIKDNDCEFTAGSGLVMSIIDTNGTATLTTYQPLDLQAGDSITITGSNYYDGGPYVLQTASDSSNTYTFSHANENSANTGTVSFINSTGSNLQASGIYVGPGPAMITNNRVKGVNVCINLYTGTPNTPLSDVTVANNWCNQVAYGVNISGFSAVSHISLAGNYFSQVATNGIYVYVGSQGNCSAVSNGFASGNMFDPEGWTGAFYNCLTNFTQGNNLCISNCT